jgi:hypothetical protein
MNTKQLSDYLKELKPSSEAILDIMTAHALKLEEKIEEVERDRDEILNGFRPAWESSHDHHNP